MLDIVSLSFPGSREAAFVYAISSAGVVYALTRACSQGELKTCKCDPHKHGRDSDEKGEFDWGGCSDNINYGIKFAKAFIDAKERTVRDARALMNLHNNRCGRTVRGMTDSNTCYQHPRGLSAIGGPKPKIESLIVCRSHAEMNFPAQVSHLVNLDLNMFPVSQHGLWNYPPNTPTVVHVPVQPPCYFMFVHTNLCTPASVSQTD